METWKPVLGFEGHYEVSLDGRVRSIDKRVNSKIRHNQSVMRRGKVLKLNPKKNGYLSVDLSKNNKKRSCSVHRLVAQSHIDNPNNLPCVNHKNGNKHDNRVDNLEWVTHKQNTQHLFGKLGHKNKLGKKILCVEKNIVFDSSTKAAEWLNRTKYGHSKQVRGMARNIRAVCVGKRNSAFGYKWEDVK